MSIDQNPGNQKHSVSPNDLPPLDQTAQVPPVHSDKLNDPAYWTQKFDGPTAKVPRKNRDKLKWHEKTSVRIGGAVAGLVAAGGVAFGLTGSNDKELNSQQQDEYMSQVNPDYKPESTKKGPVSIDDLEKKATPEQIQWVIDHPVNVREFPEVEQQVAEIGKRWHVILNSGDIDYDTPSKGIEDVHFTKKSMQEQNQMMKTIMTDEFIKKQQHLIDVYRFQFAAVLSYSPAATTYFGMSPVGEPRVVDGKTRVKIQDFNRVVDPGDDRWENSRWQDDHEEDLYLETDADGNVRVADSGPETNLGDLG